MALIAIYAATASYYASTAEFTASSCARTLEQAEHFELGRREAYVHRYYEHNRWILDDQLHQALARGASHVTAVNDADAQLELTAARLDKPIEDLIDPYLEPGIAQSNVPAAIAKRAQKDVRDLGIRNHCANSEALTKSQTSSNDRSADYLQPLRTEIAAFHERVIAYDLISLLFLVVLAALAVVDAIPTARRPLRTAFDHIITFGAALVGIYAIVWVDHDLFGWFAACFVVLVLLSIGLSPTPVRRYFGTISPPAGTTSPAALHAEAPEREHGHDPESSSDKISRLRKHNNIVKPFKRWLLVLVALTAFASALLEYKHGQATTTSDKAEETAVSEEIALLHTGPPSEFAAFGAIRRMALARESSIRSNAFSILRDKAVATDATVWAREADRSVSTMKGLMTSSQQHGDVPEPLPALLDRSDGPYGDPSFPREYFAHGTVYEPAVRLATWDAHDAERAAYALHASVALGTITLCGIALYLFGQSLGMGGTQGGWVLLISGVGVLIAAASYYFFGASPTNVDISNNVTQSARPIECKSNPKRGEPVIDPSLQSTSEGAAAACYALAQVRGQLARTPTQYREALQLFEAAAQLRTGFTLADFGASAISSKVWTPQRHTLHVSLVDTTELADLRYEDQQIERDLALRGLGEPSTLAESRELHDYLDALIHPSKPSLNATIVRAKGAIAKEHDSDPRVLMRYRAAVALLADGRSDEAQDMYRAAFRDIDPSGTNGGDTNDPDYLEVERRSEDTAGAAISDLEFVRTRCSILSWLTSSCAQLTPDNGTIDELKSEIICHTWPDRCTGAHGTKQIQLSVAWTLGGVSWRVPAALGATFPRGRIVTLVYRRDGALKTWYVVPQLSYPVRESEFDTKDGWMRVTRFLHVGSDYTECLQLGAEYRVEVYVDGALAGHADFPTSHVPSDAQFETRQSPDDAEFEATALRTPGVGMCYPSGWKFTTSSSGRMVAGFRSRNRNQGAFGFAFLGHRGLTPAALSAEKHGDINRAVRIVVAELLPQAPLRATLGTPGRCERYFARDVSYDEYRAGPFTLRAKVWESEGLISVGVVWDRTARPPDGDISCLILASMTRVDSKSPQAEEEEERVLATLLP